ncbi:L-arabinose isomerase [Fimbriimonas ginsengisoli]|uniref:L-arabinose isomerase n=1 Tax=Fimbriimonas ginsengisoli Gsoil 348 TaxID=661478 RepID=A0A068NPQ8_FIMGI|nr:L-arabinose isomerase [Fimbriimonas ginsengisoli]AIE85431.1 L-arabinose isomerase [Fimbriimonas ginsengisoli Gsoil 348]
MSPIEIWFVTGSQHLYGEETLRQVADNSRRIAEALDGSLPVKVVFKPVLTDPDAIRKLCLEATASENCAGLILWMHTFSPAKMWIGGLSQLRKPVCHLHTQFNRDLPWQSIDMDFMNLNQAAHGDREAGHLHTRIGLRRKVVVGHWSDPEVLERLGAWARVTRGWHDLQGARFARFGDNMREVSVTEGDKVAAEMRFGFSVNGYGVGDLVATVNQVTDTEIESLYRTYQDQYDLTQIGDAGPVKEAARLEIGIRAFLEQGGFKGFTTTFEDLHGLTQLPGLACQRLMADGYGFGAEGDWKTAALLRFMKTVGQDLPGGTSFMEDYTYHLDPVRPQVLGAHMLEVCPTIAKGKPRLEVHPLGIGGKADPARLVFDAPAGPALNASLVDLGHRFRLIVNEVDAVEVPPMPNLPVARALWEPKPGFKTALTAWIYAGGAHHTGYSYAVTTEHLRDFAEIAGVEVVVIGEETKLEAFRNELRWNEAVWPR